jgi:hypothetical protein
MPYATLQIDFAESIARETVLGRARGAATPRPETILCYHLALGAFHIMTRGRGMLENSTPENIRGAGDAVPGVFVRTEECS